MVSTMRRAAVRFLVVMSDAMAAAAALMAILMVGHVTADVLARNLLGYSFEATTDMVSLYYMVAIVCLPLAWIEVRNEQIFVELLFGRLPRPARRFLVMIAAVATGVFFLVFAFVTLDGALLAMARNERSMSLAETLIWPARFILPASFTVLALVSLSRATLVLLDDPRLTSADLLSVD